ncbi:hypothetical protein GCM10010193_56930 [Kitasatospora atroaurantiaca]|uniref:Uncharacterized protein n=1 Tax=Kitasatospora atroaurantiaca TaxID=285545 RepID=A0A561EMY7_9ACTN|nr:hypothetical protein [Kitasatospora atroaurantiaca]TWE16942.1 hypothetical protein FB465_1937 [Kitasatospora atroaurantiaca]
MSTTTADEFAAQLATQLPDWVRSTENAGPPGATYLTHPDGHRLGLRLQPHGLSLQTWITAGPLPDLPASTTPAEAAKAQTALDARLQPGRTWHAVLHLKSTKDPHKTLATLATKHLLRVLAVKPRRAASRPNWLEGEPLARIQLTRATKRTITKREAAQ